MSSTTVTDTKPKPARKRRQSKVSPDGKWETFPGKKNLRRYVPTGEFHIYAKVNGRHFCKATGKDKIGEAELIRDQELLKARQDGADPAKVRGPEADFTIGQLVPVYQNRLPAQNLSKKTAAKRLDCLNSLKRTWADVPAFKGTKLENLFDLHPCDLRFDDLLKWKTYFVLPKEEAQERAEARSRGEKLPRVKRPDNAGLSADYFNKTLDSLRELLDISVEAGGIRENPAKKVSWASVVETTRFIPTVAQFRLVLHEFDNGYRNGKTDDCEDLARGLAYTGLRREEAQLLRVRHVDLKSGWLRLPKEIVKGRKQARTVPIFSEALPLFERLCYGKKPDQTVFNVGECDYSLKRACRQAEVPELTHHDLRHFFASMAYHQTKDAQKVAKWLGHRDGGKLVLKLYSHVLEDHEEEAKQQIRFNLDGEDETPENVIQLNDQQYTKEELEAIVKSHLESKNAATK